MSVSAEYQKDEESKLLAMLKGDSPNIAHLKQRVWYEKGLISFAVRKKAWMYFIGEDPEKILHCPEYSEDYHDDHQIEVDVRRSFVHFDAFRDVSEDELKERRAILTRVIRSLMIESPEKHYYQGFHDIVEFLLLYSQFDMDWTYTLMKGLMKSYISDFMGVDLENVQILIRLVFPVLHRRCPALIPILKYPEETPVVILPWIITLFSHSLSSTEKVARLFDVMLIHPVLPIYIAAALVLHYKDKLLENAEDRTNVYVTLNHLDDQNLPIEKIIKDVEFSYHSLPPSSLLLRGQRDGILLPDDSMIPRAVQDQKQQTGVIESVVNSIRESILSFTEMARSPGGTKEATTGVLTVAAVGIVMAAVVGLVINHYIVC